MRRCPKCGNMESESARFCSVCGTNMEGAARQNPFRSDDEPTVVLNTDQIRAAEQNGQTEKPRAYTEADQPSCAESNVSSSGGGNRKRGGKGRYIAVIIVLAVLIVAVAAVFVVTLTGIGGSDEADEQSGSVVQSDSTLTDIFSEESEEDDETEAEDEADESEVIAEEEEEEDADSSGDDAEEDEETSESTAAAEAVVADDEEEEEEETDEDNAEDTDVSSSIASDTSSEASESSSGKTYDGVTITTDYVLADSSSTYLSRSDLVGLSAQELKIARNEIYARHGRTFNDSELQAYFDSCSWYSGTVSPDDFDADVLNDYEVENLSTIRDYETEMGYN